MRKQWIFFIIFLCVCRIADSQDVLMDKEVDYTFEEDYGPNLRRYSHFYLGTGFFVLPSEGDGAEIVLPSSRTFHLGYRFKYRITEFVSLGHEIEYNHQSYALAQESGKIFPNADLHDKEKLVLDNAGWSAYLRLNISRRGNIMGNFLDVGGFINGSFLIRHISKNEIDDPSYLSGYEKTVRKKLDYPEKYQYGLKARIGINRYVVTAEYRLSDLFKSEYDQYPELSRLWIGVQLGLH